jgi:transposase InsO family protein
VSLVASTLGVARSTVYERVTGAITTRGRYTKADDAQLLPLIQHIAAKRPTYGYRRIAAVLNRQLRAEGVDPVNHKRIYRIMAVNRLLLARRYTKRPDYAHDGVVVTIRSNLRWCSDSLEFTCWNGEVVRAAFAHTLKRDYVRVSPLPDVHSALTSLAGWIEDYNEHHPHSGLKIRPPRGHRAMGSTTA